jgi:FkbM family methyltransferase
MMHSQNDEEAVILAHFGGRMGRLLDIGAYDGLDLSNSRALLLAGWGGVLVEPNPQPCSSMLARYDGRSDIKCVCALVGDKPGLTRFLDCYSDMLSTTDPEMAKSWGAPYKFRPLWSVMVTVRDLLNEFGSHFDFVTIDVESDNLAVLKQCPFAEMGTELVCVEYGNGQPVETTVYLDSIGYKVIHATPQNLIARKQ